MYGYIAGEEPPGRALAEREGSVEGLDLVSREGRQDNQSNKEKGREIDRGKSSRMYSKKYRKKKIGIGEELRYRAFFFLDALSGGEAKKRYLENLKAWKSGTSPEDTQARLRALIRHAVQTVPYYRDFDPDTPIEQMPIMDKESLRQSYDAHLSSPFLHAKGNRRMSTSGSTGTPFTVIQDKRKAACDRADGIFLGEVANYRIGERMAFFRVWVKNVQKSRFRLFAENSLMIDSSDLGDAALQRIAETLRKEKVHCICGYSSALGVLIDFLLRTKADPKAFSVTSIIPISESMPDPVRRDLKSFFRCPVRAWYSNEENGIMGIQAEDDNSYYINSESYYYEILKMDEDTPAEDGELGRIVITDLTNYAFPMIRYANGDLAIAEHRKGRNGNYKLILKELYGRRSDLIFDTSGRPVTPYVITNNLWNVPGIRQFQFIQKGRTDYELRLNGDPSGMDMEDILGRIRPYFGPEASFKVTFVDEIPVLNSGKRKYICNESTDMNAWQKDLAEKVYDS